MTKIISFILVLLSIVVFTGCEEVPEVNNAPVITGQTSIVLSINTDAPDWSSYVTVLDEEDGSIIVDESMIESNVDFSTPGMYEVVYTVLDSESLSAVHTMEVEIVDDREYTFEIIGEDVITIEVYDTYTDQGASAKDADNLNVSVAVDNQVNTNVLGTYSVTYTMNGYNHTLVRTVHVVDTTAPELIIHTKTISVHTEDVDWSADINYGTDNYDTELEYSEVEDNVIYGIEGTYLVTVSAEDNSGNSTNALFFVIVATDIYSNPTGVYDFSDAPAELRHQFFAAAERYLLETLSGGIPLYTNNGHLIHSPRLVLPFDRSITLLGYGNRFATMITDDSIVLMYDGSYGNSGEYTYRTASTNNPTTYNHFIATSSSDFEFMDEYVGSLYDFVVNEDKNGYDVIPIMASSDPIAINSSFTTYGDEESTTWKIPIREDMEWSYYNNGEVPSYVTDNTITSEDFVESIKIALDEHWYNATNGLNNNNVSTNMIDGLEDYIAGEGSWEDVGIKVVENNIEFTFIKNVDSWFVKQWLTSNIVSPINVDMYNELGDTYGTSPQTIAYHGPYVISEQIDDTVIKFEKNPNYAVQELDFFTHKTFQIVENDEDVLPLFVQGKLDISDVDNDNYEDYENHPNLKSIPGSTTWRLNINGFGSINNQNQVFPDSTYIPEPILANENFREAMYFAIDRRHLAEDILKTASPSMNYYSDAYLVDVEYGIPYRYTDWADSVMDGMSPATYGFNEAAAHALFMIAVETEINNGNYVAGTEENPTVIEIQLDYFSNSESQLALFNYLEQTFESNFIDEENWIIVDIIGQDRSFPGIYFNYIMNAQYDLAIGGISGSTLNAASHLDTFASDNRGGYTLNWGIDTTQPNIYIEYEDPITGIIHHGYWSYDAIEFALNGEVILDNGAISAPPSISNPVMAPTSLRFSIAEYNNSNYTNITYTLKYFDVAERTYLDVEGYTDIPVEPGSVTINNLTPGFIDYPARHNGDYIIVIEYTSAYNLDFVREAISDSIMLPSTIASVTDNSTATEIDVTLVLDPDFNIGIESVKLLSSSYNIIETDNITLFGLNINITELSNDTKYILEITYIDGTVDYLIVNTTT